MIEPCSERTGVLLQLYSGAPAPAASTPKECMDYCMGPSSADRGASFLAWVWTKLCSPCYLLREGTVLSARPDHHNDEALKERDCKGGHVLIARPVIGQSFPS